MGKMPQSRQGSMHGKNIFHIALNPQHLGCVIGRGNFFFIKKMRSSEKSLIYYVNMYIAFLSQKLYFDVV